MCTAASSLQGPTDHHHHHPAYILSSQIVRSKITSMIPDSDDLGLGGLERGRVWPGAQKKNQGTAQVCWEKKPLIGRPKRTFRNDARRPTTLGNRVFCFLISPLKLSLKGGGGKRPREKEREREKNIGGGGRVEKRTHVNPRMRPSRKGDSPPPLPLPRVYVVCKTKPTLGKRFLEPRPDFVISSRVRARVAL